MQGWMPITPKPRTSWQDSQISPVPNVDASYEQSSIKKYATSTLHVKPMITLRGRCKSNFGWRSAYMIQENERNNIDRLDTIT